MGSFSSIALQGLQQAEVQLNDATELLASAGTDSSSGANLDVVDLSSQVVAVTAAQTLAELSMESLKTADQIQQNAINLVG